MKSIGIVIPAYNENENIIKLLNNIRKKSNYLIIIVDDSSNLNTKKVLTKYKFRLPVRKGLDRGPMGK